MENPHLHYLNSQPGGWCGGLPRHSIGRCGLGDGFKFGMQRAPGEKIALFLIWENDQ